MLVCRDSSPVAEVSTSAAGDVEQWVTTMDASGRRVTGDVLGPAADAAVVRIRDDQLQVSAGPFLEGEEALLGFDLLECRDLAEAIDVASAHPLAKRCVLELRPIRSTD